MGRQTLFQAVIFCSASEMAITPQCLFFPGKNKSCRQKLMKEARGCFSYYRRVILNCVFTERGFYLKAKSFSLNPIHQLVSAGVDDMVF